MTRQPLRRRRPFIPPPKAISAVDRRLAALPAGLRAHVERTRSTAIQIAYTLGAELPKVDFALAAHDLFRAATPDSLLAEAERRGCAFTAFEQRHPLLLHGPVAALWLAQDAGVDDRELLDAVTYHTTFAPGLGKVEATVFLADKVEPDKLARTPWLAEVRDLAASGRPAEAIVVYLTRLSDELRQTGGQSHPRAAAAIVWLRERRSV